MTLPLVSCIMPTANREKYIPYAVKYFLHQDYPSAELIIVDDGKRSVAPLIPDHPKIRYYYTKPIGTIGLKRNHAIELAKGEIIMHWDDDDWHASDWIRRQVQFLQSSGADITGIRHVHYFSPVANTFWQGDAHNRNNPKAKVWLNGATLGYLKSYWKKHHFKDLQTGEDDDFIQHEDAKVYAHDYINGFVAILHPHNTTVKAFENLRHKKNS
jgi:glycosyltransferase involved in cell wall biosynthesis